MRSTCWVIATALATCLFAGNAMAQGLRQPLSVRPAAFDYEHYLDDEVASPSDANAAAEEAVGDDASADPAPAEEAPSAAQESAPAAASTVEASCGCSSGCDSCASDCCDSGGCDSSCGCSSCCSLDLSCCLGDAWTLSSHLLCKDSCWNVGGWFQAGYHSESNGLFNNRPDELNLQQSWLYIEKTANPTCCNLDWGFRADIMYGTDGTDTQAFGNEPGKWDFLNGFDHGSYSWAIPQLYGEIAGDGWSVKAGHFYTLVGYEVVPATGNFFYSHAITMFLSEPFTHTGALITYEVSEALEVYAGWTLGWDTGFDQHTGAFPIGFEHGSSWLGGFKAQVTDDASFTYVSTLGNLGWRGDDAYTHSLLFDVNLTDKLNYVLQSDILRVKQTGEDNVGVNQYLFYTVNDCVKVGTRLEWWKGDVNTGYAPHGGNPLLSTNGSLSYYEATFGVNVKPHANLTIRPEYRYDWSPAANYSESIFAVDAYVTF